MSVSKHRKLQTNNQKDKGNQRQSVQIIGGIYRHRKIDFIAADDLRPTGARSRETLFNWLQPYLHDANCLDLFAGSGILGFEAISRGAKSVTFVEKNRQVAAQLKKNITMLKIGQETGQEIPQAKVINNSANDALKTLTNSYDIIFLDPPYSLQLLPELLDAIKPLMPKWIFIEDNKPFEDWINSGKYYEIHKNKKAGNIYYGLLKSIVK